MFGYLALHAGAVVSDATLIDSLWGDDPPPSALKTLQTLVFRLRKALASVDADAVIERAGSGYRLAVDPSDVDATECERLAATGRSLRDRGDTGAATAAFHDALGLWRGDPFPELAGTSIAEGERTRLLELRAAIAVDHLDARVAGGAGREVISDLEAALTELPYEERLYGLLMIALYRAGRQGDALAVFPRARARLVDDLGVEPGPQLREIERQVIEQDPGLQVSLGSSSMPPSPGEHDDQPLPPDWAEVSWIPPSMGGFVGREMELTTATQVWARVSATGERQLLLVGGEPGMGKSRLAAELARVVIAEGGLVLRGVCDPGSGSYAPFSEAFDNLAARASSSTIEGWIAGVDPAARRVTALVPALDGWEPSGVDVEDETERTIRAFAQLVQRVTSVSPTLLIIDDLHWATTLTVRLLLHLVRHTIDTPLLVLGTHRLDLQPECALRVHLSELHRTERMTTVMLDGLGGPEVADYVAGEIGQPLDSDLIPFAAELRNLTGGNPFFLGSLLGYLRDRGALTQRSGRWQIRGGVLDQGLPTGVTEVIAGRIAHLSEGGQTALRAAAIVGSTFDINVIGQMVGSDRSSTLDALEESRNAGLSVEGASFGRFSFSHDLIRQVLLSQVGRTRRVQWHWAAALALRAVPTSAQEIGRHVREGLAAADSLSAVPLLRTAATAALVDGAPEVAVEFLDDALGSVSADDLRTVADLHVERAVALLETDIELDDPLFLAACVAAEDSALRCADPNRIVRSLTLDDRWASIEIAETVDRRRIAAADRALAVVSTNDPDPRALLMAHCAALRIYDADHATRMAFCHNALSLIDESSPAEVRERVLINVAQVFYTDPDRVPEARRLAQQLLDLGRPTGVALGFSVLAVTDVLYGRLDAVAAAADVINEHSARTYGSRAGEVLARFMRACVAVARSDWDIADRLIEELRSAESRPRTRPMHQGFLRLALGSANSTPLSVRVS